MIHHVDFSVADFARSRDFYVRALAPLGLGLVIDRWNGRELAGFGAALEAGGRDHGAPGLRPRYTEQYYAAYVLDLDGHNIEAVCRLPGYRQTRRDRRPAVTDRFRAGSDQLPGLLT